MQDLMEYRMRSKISPEELKNKIGRIVLDEDYNLVITGPTRLLLPSGEPLCVYLPKAISAEHCESSYPILTAIRNTSDNRSYASGSQGVRSVNAIVYREIYSSIIGSIEPMGGNRFPYCRTTAWTGSNANKFAELFPLFEVIGQYFAEYVPERYVKQKKMILNTAYDWRIGNTPFTTITVNNTYPTGVHRDKGDLEEGFSCLMSLRKGKYTGGNLVFPEYRVSINMQHGDLLLMDAHQWHGNTNIVKQSDDAERISLVLYYRTGMMYCGTKEIEDAKQLHQRSKPLAVDKRDEAELESQFVSQGNID